MEKDFQWLLFFFALATSQGVVQEIVFYNSVGNYFGFVTAIPDATRIPFGNITRICSKGLWVLYNLPDYEDVAFGLAYGSTLRCWNKNLTSLSSFRYLGASDTDLDGVSLYMDNTFEGPELFISVPAYAGISMPVRSVAITGSSRWQAWEGVNFNGSTTCFTSSPTGPVYIKALNASFLPNIGSILRGCYLPPNAANDSSKTISGSFEDSD